MRDQKGFTLIELVVVVFLVGVFFLLAIPKFK
ncbi:MAG: prepilin-type N-terminal cleavage/methylation domain-containing protein, partial [Thermodesulfobacteriota bacterium]